MPDLRRMRAIEKINHALRTAGGFIHECLPTLAIRNKPFMELVGKRSPPVRCCCCLIPVRRTRDNVVYLVSPRLPRVCLSYIDSPGKQPGAADDMRGVLVHDL